MYLKNVIYILKKYPVYSCIKVGQSQPKPAYQLSSGFSFGKPRPRKAKPSQQLSGQAKLAHHLP